MASPGRHSPAIARARAPSRCGDGCNILSLCQVFVVHQLLTSIARTCLRLQGALSAWARLRLPHLVSFAFSTSSPVHAQYEFSQYCDVVSAALSNPAIGGSQACLASVAAAFSEIDSALRGSPAQQAAVAARLFSCAPPQSIDDVKLLASNAAGVLMGIVQYNDDGVPGPDVNSTCAFMTQPGVDPVDLLGQLWLQTTPGQNCR